MAEAFFEKFSGESDEAKSAGTHVFKKEGIKIGEDEGAKFVWEVMNEEDIDLRDKERTQLSKELVNWADKIVVMTEKENWPDYIEENGNKLVIWAVDDAKGKSLEFHRKTRDQIKKLVRDFI